MLTCCEMVKQKEYLQLLLSSFHHLGYDTMKNMINKTLEKKKKEKSTYMNKDIIHSLINGCTFLWRALPSQGDGLEWWVLHLGSWVSGKARNTRGGRVLPNDSALEEIPARCSLLWVNELFCVREKSQSYPRFRSDNSSTNAHQSLRPRMYLVLYANATSLFISLNLLTVT